MSALHLTPASGNEPHSTKRISKSRRRCSGHAPDREKRHALRACARFPPPPHHKNTLRRVASPPSSTWAHEKGAKIAFPQLYIAVAQWACCTRSSVRIVHFLQNGATGAYYRLLSVRTCVNTHKTIRYHTTGHHTTRNSHLKPLPVQHDIIARRHRSHCWSAGRRRGRAPRSPQ